MTHNTIIHQELIRLTKNLQSGTHTPEQLVEAIQRLESVFNTVSQDCDQLTEQNKILQKQINTYQTLIENLKKEQEQEIDSLKILFQQSLNSLEQEQKQEIQSLESDLTTYKNTILGLMKQENDTLNKNVSTAVTAYNTLMEFTQKQEKLIVLQNELLNAELNEASKTQQLQELQAETVSLETKLAELKADEQNLQKQLQAHKNEYQNLSWSKSG